MNFCVSLSIVVVCMWIVFISFSIHSVIQTTKWIVCILHLPVLLLLLLFLNYFVWVCGWKCLYRGVKPAVCWNSYVSHFIINFKNVASSSKIVIGFLVLFLLFNECISLWHVAWLILVLNFTVLDECCQCVFYLKRKISFHFPLKSENIF